MYASYLLFIDPQSGGETPLFSVQKKRKNGNCTSGLCDYSMDDDSLHAGGDSTGMRFRFIHCKTSQSTRRRRRRWRRERSRKKKKDEKKKKRKKK